MEGNIMNTNGLVADITEAVTPEAIVTFTGSGVWSVDFAT
jgi:hypothetical protein